MAPKLPCFLALLLLLSSSAAAAERLHPQWAAGCWNEICQVPDCLFSILKAFLPKTGGGSPIDAVSVPCCSAFLTLTEDCQVEIFQNSSVITLIQTFCSAVVPPPVAPGPGTGGDMPWPWPSTPVAPGPGNDGDMPWPGAPAAGPASGGDEADADSTWPTVRFV
ncbi:unnamed protein product [Linum tenue]|uniref:Prolamin-like domain-containing protein n=1 Tax=Linum tenue TaxID=586396 RepID=A0AAV0HX59_9ROSI|nr:unnamed protein product [Linum tenue]